MKNKKLCLSIMVLLISTIAIISCGKSSGYTSGASNPQPAMNSVSIVNMSFSPVTLSIAIGTTVTWTNNDGMIHTVTADDISFDSGNIAIGGKFSKVFSA